jgi:hypothetical protein
MAFGATSELMNREGWIVAISWSWLGRRLVRWTRIICVTPLLSLAFRFLFEYRRKKTCRTETFEKWSGDSYVHIHQQSPAPSSLIRTTWAPHNCTWTFRPSGLVSRVLSSRPFSSVWTSSSSTMADATRQAIWLGCLLTEPKVKLIFHWMFFSKYY